MAEINEDDIVLSRRIAVLEAELTDVREKLSYAQDATVRLERLYTSAHGYGVQLKQQLKEWKKNHHSCCCMHRLDETVQDDCLDANAMKHRLVDSATQYDEVDTIASSIDNHLCCDDDVVQPLLLASTDETSRTILCDAADWSTGLPQDGSQSIADCVREVVENIQSGFVYDEPTRLYYDCNTGYYYDAENCLYYEPQYGAYYSYDQEAQAYEFHSYIDRIKYQTLYHIIYSRISDVQASKHSDERRKTRQRKNKMEKVIIDESLYSDEKTPASSFDRETNFHTKDEGGTKDLVALNSSSYNIHAAKENDQHTSITDDVKSGEAMETVNTEHEDDGTKITSSSETSQQPTLCSTAILDERLLDASSESGLEDGELSSSDEDCESELMSIHHSVVPELVFCPPCIRAIVKRSDCLPVGKLYILTCTGATIGRQTDLNHAIMIPDLDVSKMHCDVQYNVDLQRYVIKDFASQSGTFVNGIRLSKAKVISEAKPVYNGDLLTIGNKTEFELHIHPRGGTCDGCEPGLIQAAALAASTSSELVEVRSTCKETDRRKLLKQMKKKFGLQNMDYECSQISSGDIPYEDKSAARRAKYGVDHPYQIDDEPASVHRPISADNVGHKMLAKLGWREGESLGKTQTGIIEPISADMRVLTKAGLGTEAGGKHSISSINHVSKKKIAAKTRERYNEIIARDSLRTELKKSETLDHIFFPTEVPKTVGHIKWIKNQKLAAPIKNAVASLHTSDNEET